jgi:rhamnosyl/mannosyltransferase
MLLAVAIVAPRVPLIVTHHSDVIKQRFLRHLVRPFECRVYQHARLFLVSSPKYLAGSASLERYADKVLVLPLGIDLDPYLKPSAAALGHARHLQKKHGDLLWLAVGRLIYYKGLDVALKALTMVPGKLLVVGTGPLNNELHLQAKALSVGERVIWLGNANSVELIGAYHAATALWFPSNARSEGFGLVQVEAMASGCPVINTAIPASGVSWVSRDGESGLTAPVNDPDAFAAKARRLVDEPHLRRHLSVGARERACRDFGQETMGRRSLGFYYEAIGRIS